MIREQSEQEQAEEKHAEEEWHKVLLQHYFGEAGINKSEREWQDDFFQDEWAEKELRKILANDKGQTREKKKSEIFGK